MDKQSDPEETQAAPTESFHTLPTVPAFENMPTLPLLSDDYQRLDYRIGMLESARMQVQHQSGPNWQPYALAVGGGLCIVVAILAVKGHISNQVVVGGMFLVGFFLLLLAICYVPLSEPGRASA